MTRIIEVNSFSRKCFYDNKFRTLLDEDAFNSKSEEVKCCLHFLINVGLFFQTNGCYKLKLMLLHQSDSHDCVKILRKVILYRLWLFCFQDCYQIVLRTLVLVLEKLERVLQMEVSYVTGSCHKFLLFHFNIYFSWIDNSCFHLMYG